MKYATYATYRDKRKVSDYKVAKENGITFSTLSLWKTRNIKPSNETQQKIALFLKIPAKIFLEDMDNDCAIKKIK